MSFAFSRAQAVEAQVRAIARHQLKAAIAEASEADFDSAVHKARRRCKRVRGLLRLIRPSFGHFDRENVALRQAANSLSGSRDAAVVIETFGSLKSFDVSRSRPARLQPALADAVMLFLDGRVRQREGEQDQDQLLASFRDQLKVIRERARSWHIEGKRFDAIEDGLTATYRRLRKRMQYAAAGQSAASFHDWRKDTKYHWHHVSLLHKAAPDVLGARKTQLAQLGEYLGDHHNLAVLDDVLVNEPNSIVETEIRTVRDIIAEQQAVLAAKAFDLGRQLAAEEPKALRDRFAAYWALLPEDK